MPRRRFAALVRFATVLSLLLPGLALPTNSAQADSTGFALQFDGNNDYVTFGPAAGLGVKTFTIETWFKRTGPGATTYTGTSGVVAVPLVTKGMAEDDAKPLDMNYFLGIESGTDYLAADFEECDPATQSPNCPGGARRASITRSPA